MVKELYNDASPKGVQVGNGTCCTKLKGTRVAGNGATRSHTSTVQHYL
jgi:hypothetical protein